ncbi:MAG: tetratricopeptide repeat protein [Bacteroidetes bacterium]|nr:tetratricopeptide repeat protein [Bacteroidota bacterium]
MKKTFLFILLFIITSTSLIAQYNKRYIYYMGQNAIIKKQYYKAINILSTLIEADSMSQDGFFLRAIAKYNLNDIVGAEHDFTNSIRINPVYVEAFQYRAITRSMMGNYNDALKDFQIALDIRPDYYKTYYSRGVTLLLNQQFKGAIEDFTKYIKQDKEGVDAYLNRGTAYLMLKDTVKALENFNSAIDVSPRYSDAYMKRGGIYNLKKEYKKALSDLDNAIKYDTTNLSAYFNRAITYSYSNNPIKAIEDFSSIIKKDSTSSLAYFNRAILRSQIGDYNNALDDYNKVIIYSPTNLLGYYNRGNLNLKLGEIENAFSDFTKSISLYNDFANAYLNRAYVRDLLGDSSGAKKDRKIAQQKINEYQNNIKTGNKDYKTYADTSKVFNSLLSFDNHEFNKKDNIKNKDIDIDILPLFKFAITEKKKNNEIDNADIKSFIKNVGTRKLTITNSPLLATDSISYVIEKNNLKQWYGGAWIDDFISAMKEYSIKQYTNSINMYDKAISNNNYNAFLYFNRSSVRCEMINFISNLDEKEQKLIINSDKSHRLERTKRTYNYKEPIKDIDYAISINPYISYFYYNKGNLLCLSGEIPQAIGSYSKAIEINPSFAEAYYNRGLAQLYLKDNKKGFLDISRAGELGLKEAYSKIKELRSNY